MGHVYEILPMRCRIEQKDDKTFVSIESQEVDLNLKSC